MTSLNDKLFDLKRKQFINSKKTFFNSTFGTGSYDMISLNDFQYPEINTIISFLESTRTKEYSYRILPSMIVELNDKADVIINLALDFFESEHLYLLYSYVFESIEEISGYVKVNKDSFLTNFDKLSSSYGFVLNEEINKFIYYKESKDATKLYVYNGSIINQKYVKLVSSNNDFQ